MKNYCMDAPFYLKVFFQCFLTIAEMKLKASIMRTESRCSHYRRDYPELDDKNWRAWINIYKSDDGHMKFEKQAFDAWVRLLKNVNGFMHPDGKPCK